jgi:uncharacterized membrane protein YkoI
MNKRRIYASAGALVLAAAAAATGLFITNSASAGQSGVLDDGKDLLPQAEISLKAAIESAQTAATGEIGEVDLEYYDGTLVFNVDVGDQDVKVDASTGEVLGMGED